jgi:Spy/CpxP family protein refolding chaperone
MRRLVIIGLVCLSALGASAQNFPRQGFPQQNFQQQQQRFSPEKYQADLEQYITKEACLTPKEAAAFFPLFREMQKKQRALYNKMREDVRIKPTDEAACKKMIQKRDQVELELKSIQQTYHNKFFSVMPASKVFDVIKAEDQYHRGLLRNMGGMGRGPVGAFPQRGQGLQRGQGQQPRGQSNTKK